MRHCDPALAEREAAERAEEKRRERVTERTAEILRSPDLILELIEDDPRALASAIAEHHTPCDCGLLIKAIVRSRALSRANREIAPVSPDDIADEIVGDISND